MPSWHLDDKPRVKSVAERKMSGLPQRYDVRGLCASPVLSSLSGSAISQEHLSALTLLGIGRRHDATVTGAVVVCQSTPVIITRCGLSQPETFAMHSM